MPIITTLGSVWVVAKTSTTTIKSVMFAFRNVGFTWRFWRTKRVRTFLRHIDSEDYRKQWDAERAAERASQDPDLLTTLMKECLFGTQKISLATLAIIAGERCKDPHDPFWASAIRSVQEISDADVCLFLRLVSRLVGTSPLDKGTYKRGWCQMYGIDSKMLAQTDWNVEKTLLGVDGHLLISAVTELISRRIFVADSGGRFGDVNEEFKIFFGMSSVTLRFYDLLYSSLRLADEAMFHGLALTLPAQVRSEFERQQASQQ